MRTGNWIRAGPRTVNDGLGASIDWNLGDFSIVEISDENIAGSIHGDTQLASQAGAYGLLAAAAGATCRDLDHLIQIVVCDEEIACSIQRQPLRELESGADGLSAVRSNLQHAAARGVGDEDIAPRVNRYALRSAQSVGRSAFDESGERAEGDRRSLANSVDLLRCHRVAEAVEEFHRTHAQSGRDGGEGDIDRAGIACGDGARAGAAAGLLKVEAGNALRDHLDRADGRTRSHGEGHRKRSAARRWSRRSRRAHIRAAETVRREGEAHELMLLITSTGRSGEANGGSPIVQVDVLRDIERPREKRHRSCDRRMRPLVECGIEIDVDVIRRRIVGPVVDDDDLMRIAVRNVDSAGAR